MEIVLSIKSENYAKVKDELLKNDTVSRASVQFKDAKMFDDKGYYCYISGGDEQCEKALELTKELAEEVEGKKKEKIISKIKEEGNTATEAFGGLFG